jgi:Tol biopolymer transport system component
VSAAFDITCSLVERIAFSLGGSISMVHADGTSTRRITGGLAPAWSPDGTRLAYECGSDICTINADGTGSRAITSGGAFNRHPTWSPDGLKIAFASSTANATDLYLAAASGAGAVRLTQGVGVVGNPAWSPDGTQIAFDCQVDAGNLDICVVRADGTGFTRLTSDPASDYGAAWEPDGSALAFATTRFGFDEIVLMSPTGGNVARIGAGLLGFSPSWSPDGTQLAFVQVFNDPYATPYEAIVTAHSDGSNVRTVTRGGQPAWRPHR